MRRLEVVSFVPRQMIRTNLDEENYIMLHTKYQPLTIAVWEIF